MVKNYDFELSAKTYPLFGQRDKLRFTTCGGAWREV